MFYKLDNENLLFGPYVFGPEYMLLEELLPDLSLPIDGWYWFTTENEARSFFGLPLIEQEE